jgi:hypothetical protein
MAEEEECPKCGVGIELCPLNRRNYLKRKRREDAAWFEAQRDGLIR